jgi:hypothetical protein
MKKYLVPLLLVIATFVVARPAYAASSLSVSPASGTFSSGSTLKVSVYANTGGENVNAVQANVSYPTDKLQFLSVSTGGSALTIFAEKYATGGVVRLAGGTPSPGFSGNKLIATISFKVLQDTGSATLSFTGESAVLRDSDNSNTLSGKGTGTYTLGKATAGTVTSSPTKASVSNGITISNVLIESVSTSQAIITWKTDIKSDSTVEYGKDVNYGFTETTKDLVTDHRVVLANYLIPGTTYHFHVRSADGTKEGTSDDATLITKGYEVIVRVKDVKGSAVLGATVTLYSEPQQQAQTDANGEAHFVNVAPGKHGVIVKQNNQTMIQEIEVVDGQPVTTVDLSFTSSNGIPMVSTPVLYGIVGFVVLLVISLVIYVVVKNSHMSSNSDTPMSSI